MLLYNNNACLWIDGYIVWHVKGRICGLPQVVNQLSACVPEFAGDPQTIPCESKTKKGCPSVPDDALIMGRSF
jgi:hypothetical protein